MSDLFFCAFGAVLMLVSYCMLKWNTRQKAAKRAPERIAEAAQNLARGGRWASAQASRSSAGAAGHRALRLVAQGLLSHVVQS